MPRLTGRSVGCRSHMAPGYTEFPYPKELMLKFITENNGEQYRARSPAGKSGTQGGSLQVPCSKQWRHSLPCMGRTRPPNAI